MLRLLLVLCAISAVAASAQVLTTLVNFDPTNGGGSGTPLTRGTDGNFYGTNGGNIAGGSIFRMTPDGDLSILYFSCRQRPCPDGEGSAAPLVQANDGNFYGTMTYGGNYDGACGVFGCGTVFRITPDGTLTTLHRFSGYDGAFPYSGLIQGRDGYLYGTTNGLSAGTFYRIGLDGSFTLVSSGYAGFAYSQLIQAADGDFYTTSTGGGNYTGVCVTYGCGYVLKLTSSGAHTILYEFCSQANCADGAYPVAGLVQGRDGNLYGTTTYFGTGQYPSHARAGTIFRITPSGALTTLYSFCSQSSCDDGDTPYGALIQGSDGNFYGTTLYGPNQLYTSPGEGTLFKITAEGAFTHLYSFCSLPGCADGSLPQAALLEVANRTFYGTTTSGGIHFASGTVYSLEANHGTLTVSTAGNGMVTSADGYIICPGICSHDYPDNTPVTLTALPDEGWTLSGWSGACSGVSDNCTVTVTQNVDVSAYFLEPGPGNGFQFAPVAPCRLIDTRQGGGPISGGSSRNFIVPQFGGGCGIPVEAAAYSLNVTVVPHEPLGYLTIWPAGLAQPYTSTMNSPDGRIKANAVIVTAGTNDAVSVYVTNLSDVILDINGYFISPMSQTLQFYPLVPCRVVDTRAGSQQPQGLGPPSIPDMGSRELPIPHSPCLQGLPNQPKAYSFNVTVVPTHGNSLNYLTVWPSDQRQPNVSTLNNPTATVVANAAIVPAAANGDISVFAYNSTDVIMDINGYFAAPGDAGVSLYPAAPCRVYDSRMNNGQPFQGERTINVVGSPCAPASSATSYVLNATVVPSGFLGYLTLWPDGQPQPFASTLNANDGLITSNMAIIPTTNGSIDAYASQLTQLVLDISAYFAP